MATLAEINVRIGAKIDQLQKGLKQAERDLTRSGRKLNRLGNDLTTAFSLPLAGAGVAAVKFAAEFETSFTKIETLVGVSGETLENFKTEIGNLSGPLASSKTALSDALFTITSAGQRGASALVTLEQASKASAIGLGETKEIARAATAAVTAYGEENLSSADAIDKFTAIVREGNLEAADLAPQLGKILPIASQLGVSFDEVGANIATFTRLGVNTSEAATGIRSLLSAIIKPSKEAKDELAKLGLTSDDLRKRLSQDGLAATLQSLVKAYDGNVEGLSKLFPQVDSLTNALGTAGAQGEDYVKIVESIQNANGLVDDGFQKVSETANFKLKKAFVNLQNVASQFGSVLIPVITDILGSITPLLDTFSKLDEGTKKLIVSTGVFAAAVGPALKVVGTAKTTYAALLGVAGQLTGGIKKAAAAFLAFDKVTKATTIGLAVAAIVAGAAALNSFSNSANVASKASERLKNAQSSIAAEVATERAELDKLIVKVKDTTLSTEERTKALQTLKQNYPGYFSDINVEKGELSALTSIQNTLNESILKGVAARKKAEVLNEIGGQIIEAELRLKQIENEGFEALTYLEQLRGGVGNLLTNDKEAVASEVVNELKTDIENLRKEAEETTASFDNLFSTGSQVRGGSRRGATGAIPGASSSPSPIAPITPIASASSEIQISTSIDDGGANEILETLQRNLELITKKNEAFGDSFDANGARVSAFQSAISNLLESGLKPSDPLIKTLGKRFENLSNPIEKLDGNMVSINGKFVNFTDALALTNEGTILTAQQQQLLNEIFAQQGILLDENTLKLLTLGASQTESTATMSEFGATATKVLTSNIQNIGRAGAAYEDFGQTAKRAILGVIRALIVEGITSVVTKALASAPPPASLILAAAAGAAAGILFDGITSNLVGLRDGGLVYGPTPVFVGEYAGAGSNPEVIAPLNKLKDIIGTGGGGNVIVEGFLSGEDLYLSNQRVSDRLTRQNGF